MKLETLLQNLGEKHFDLLLNEGNAGDGLIHAGCYKLAARLGLTFKPLEYPEDRRGKNLLLVGAGAFCRGSSHNVDPVRFYAERFENIYILPATFETSYRPIEGLLREMPANVTIFCREQISYDAVLKLVPQPDKVYLDHDVAFQVDPTSWLKPGRGELNAFRTDNESRLGRVPSPNFDVSNMGREYHHTLLLDTLSHFETINTDRLHISIAGALLGKQVRLFENSNHKIRGIYNYSMRKQYPNVALCDSKEMKRILSASYKKAFRRWLFPIVTSVPGAKDFIRQIKNRKLSKSTL